MQRTLALYQNEQSQQISIFLSVPKCSKEDLAKEIEFQSTVVWLDTSYVKAGLRSQWGEIPGRDGIFRISLSKENVDLILDQEKILNNTIKTKWESFNIGENKFDNCRFGLKHDYFLEKVLAGNADKIVDIFDEWKKEEKLYETNQTSYPLNYNYGEGLSIELKNYLNIALTPQQVEEIKNKKNSPKLERNKEEAGEEGDEKKARLTTSNEIYDRIIHDSTMDEELFVIGYLDRFTGIKETEFKKFVTLEKELYYNSSVPFHRVQYFKYKGILVWDRETRLNLIDNNQFLNIE